ncbi:hypothetical protein BSNK01_24600 [Bacillaceae bacterium]
MNVAFSCFFFVFSMAFTVMSAGFPVVTDGKPGAGFFPLSIGVAMMFFSAVNCWKDLKERKRAKSSREGRGNSEREGKSEHGGEKKYVKDMVFVLVLIVLFIFFLKILGALLSMILFIFAALCFFDRRRVWQNVLLSVLVPLAIFLLLDVWLNAGLPKGFLGFI